MRGQLKILVVDDDEDTRELFHTVLTGEGYQVALANNGQDALVQSRNDSFDLVITDLKMPVTDGLQFLQEIRKTGSNADVIMVTGHGEVESYLHAMSLGAVEYIHKPIRIRELKKIVRMILKKRES